MRPAQGGGPDGGHRLGSSGQPHPPLVARLDALPLRRGSLAAAHLGGQLAGLDARSLPLHLAHLHHALRPDAELTCSFPAGSGADPAAVTLPRLAAVLAGAGFAATVTATGAAGAEGLVVRARRAVTLADTVGPGMRLLVVGLNPSVASAEGGIPYARRGNRFWPAALAAGVATRDRDQYHLLAAHRVGMTDFVKRVTNRAEHVGRDEFRAGAVRVERLVRWLQPTSVCVVGLAGWRAARDRRATAGWIAGGLGGRPAYLMPATSGLNAATPLAALVEHLRTAASGPPPDAVA